MYETRTPHDNLGRQVDENAEDVGENSVDVAQADPGSRANDRTVADELLLDKDEVRLGRALVSSSVDASLKLRGRDLNVSVSGRRLDFCLSYLYNVSPGNTLHVRGIHWDWWVGFIQIDS